MGCGPKCSGCPLERAGTGFTQIEIGARYEKGKVLICGEASGEAESREGLPFRPHAQSGSLLADAMREVAVSRGDVAITNVIRCRPPKDWLEGAPWQYGAINHCIREYLIPAIQELKPKSILALGGTAFRALTATPKGKYGTLDYARGYVWDGVGAAEGIPVIGTYHPAFLRRGSAHLTPLLQRDLRRAYLVGLGKFKWGMPDNLMYQTSPTIHEAWEYYRNLSPLLPISFDIETPRSTRSDEDERTSFVDRDIKLFQCTQRRGAGIALPYRDEFVDVIRAIMATPNDKIGWNNWSFDDPVLEGNGVRLNGRLIDAMVMFGTMQPDLPKNLQAGAQFCGFPFPWKHFAETDLGFYGIADVDAALCGYEYTRKVLESEGRWEAFERYFADVWPILKDMARRGVPVDNERRLALKELIQSEDIRITAEIQTLVPAEVLSTKQKNGLKKIPKDTTGLVQIEYVVKEGEKCRCTKKTRGTCLVCMGLGIIPVGTIETRWALPVEFNPNSSLQVKKFMKFHKHPIPKHAKRTDSSGEASDTTEVKELERLWTKTKHPIYPLLIQKRQLTKVAGTYVDGWEPSKDGCVHTTYTFQTATWQTSSRAPNVQNGLKRGKSDFQKNLANAFNAMQKAESGKILINFDFKSFHALTTAHDFNIPSYARLARIDIHSFVACQFLKLPECQGLFERDDEDMLQLFKYLRKDPLFKEVRDVRAKQTILGIQFGRGPTSIYTMYKEFFESVAEAKVIWSLVYSLFPRLRIAQNEIKAKAAEDKRLTNKFGAVRHFYDVERFDRKQQKMVGGDQAEEAVAFIPASHAFGHFRDNLLRIRANGWDEKFGLCNQIHDSMVFHCPIELRKECVSLISAEMQKPSGVLIYPKMAPEGLSVEAEAGWGESLAEIK